MEEEPAEDIKKAIEGIVTPVEGEQSGFEFIASPDFLKGLERFNKHPIGPFRNLALEKFCKRGIELKRSDYAKRPKKGRPRFK